MQKQFYLTEESWEQLKYIAKDRSYSEVIRELIYLAYEDRMHEEAGGPFDETLEAKKV